MSAGCMCFFNPCCDGMGSVACFGCGGDLCICTCGGVKPCPGCSECPAYDCDDLDGPDDLNPES